VNVGSSVNEALAGLERTRDILKENIEEADPKRTANDSHDHGEIELKMLDLRTTPENPCLHDVSFRGATRNRNGAGGPSGAGKPRSSDDCLVLHRRRPG